MEPEWWNPDAAARIESFLAPLIQRQETQLAGMARRQLRAMPFQRGAIDAMTLVRAAGFPPTRWPFVIMYFAWPLGHCDAECGLLEIPDSAWQAVADGKSGKVHVTASRKSIHDAHQTYARGLPALQTALFEGKPKPWPPLPNHSPASTVTLPAMVRHERGLAAFPFEKWLAIRQAPGIRLPICDPLQSSALTQVIVETKYRISTLLALQGRHLLWANPDTVSEILPPPGRGGKRAGPQQLHASGRTLAAHAKRLGITPTTGHDAYLWRDIRTMLRMQPGHCRAIVRRMGDSIGVKRLTPNGLRSASITAQAILGLPAEDSAGLNDHASSDTDWHYMRPDEAGLYTALCLAADVHPSLEPGCCKECGRTDAVNLRNLCNDCDPTGPRAASTGQAAAEDIIALAVQLLHRAPTPTERRLIIKSPRTLPAPAPRTAPVPWKAHDAKEMT